jgi:hypothetical protein
MITMSAEDAELYTYGDRPEGNRFELVEDTHVEDHRWYEVRQIVLRNEDTGHFYRAYYERGLTELQEDHEPFDGAHFVQFKHVVQRPVEHFIYEDDE